MQLLDQKTKAILLGGEVSYDVVRKQAFHGAAKRFLKRIADEHGLAKEQYDLRSNLGGFAVSGEITLQCDFNVASGRGSLLHLKNVGRKYLW